MSTPVIEALSLLLLAGGGALALPFLRSVDPVEVAAIQAGAEAALVRQREIADVRAKNLATMIGNRVGEVVARALAS